MVLSGEPSIKLDEYELGNIMITGRALALYRKENSLVLSGEPSIVLDGKERGGNIMIKANRWPMVHLRSKYGEVRMHVLRISGSQVVLGAPDRSAGVMLGAGKNGPELILSNKRGSVSVGAVPRAAPEDPLHIFIYSDNKTLFQAP